MSNYYTMKFLMWNNRSFYLHTNIIHKSFWRRSNPVFLDDEFKSFRSNITSLSEENYKSFWRKLQVFLKNITTVFLKNKQVFQKNITTVFLKNITTVFLKKIKSLSGKKHKSFWKKWKSLSTTSLSENKESCLSEENTCLSVTSKSFWWKMSFRIRKKQVFLNLLKVSVFQNEK